jgi:hypothetical protein
VSPLPEALRNGLVGRIELGQTETAKMLGGVLYIEVATPFQHPYYQVTYEDGDTKEHTGRDKTCILKLKVNKGVFKGDLGSVGAIEAFLREEEVELRSFQEGFLSSARAARILCNYRLAAGSLESGVVRARAWRSWPLAGEMFGLYMGKLYKDRDSIGTPTTTKNAMGLLCSMNDVDPAPYNTFRVTASLEAVHRDHKRAVKKSAGLTVGMM